MCVLFALIFNLPWFACCFHFSIWYHGMKAALSVYIEIFWLFHVLFSPITIISWYILIKILFLLEPSTSFLSFGLPESNVQFLKCPTLLQTAGILTKLFIFWELHFLFYKWEGKKAVITFFPANWNSSERKKEPCRLCITLHTALFNWLLFSQSKVFYRQVQQSQEPTWSPLGNSFFNTLKKLLDTMVMRA